MHLAEITARHAPLPTCEETICRVIRIEYVLHTYAEDPLQKKLTITVSEPVYEGLYRVVGAGNISQFIERLVRPHVLPQELDNAYAKMAQDTDREAEALEWSESMISGADDETR